MNKDWDSAISIYKDIISKSPNNFLKEHIFKGENEFIDFRGKISNYELSEPVNLIGYIESKKGTVRANHFHPIQEQKCILTKGQFISVYQDLLNSKSQKTTHVVNEGDLIVNNDSEIGKVLISKNYPFAVIKYTSDKFNFNSTFKINDAKIKIIKPNWL